ncbi:MAG: C40 family peptidase [Agathobacter sp.]|nr:C40 family peptidase [Agathobacter sp.]MBQ3559364.1 C40 family peptidase [Agathobacter sp.]
MINKGVRLTAGLLVAALLVTTVPAEVFAGQTVESTNYITGTSYSFSAGAHSAIGETVVLEDATEDELYAGVEENEAPVVAEPANPYANIAIAKVNEYLNIRTEANPNAAVLGKLYNNGAATVLETLDGWYKVTSGSVTGYVSADYVVVGDEATCKAVSQRVGTVITDALRIRKEASTEAGVYTLLTEGNKMTVLDESMEGWLKVQYRSYVGYVASEYVSVETVYNYAESKEEERARLEAEAAAKKQQQASSSSNKHYNAPASKEGQAVVDYAVQFVGNPYVWGGTSLTNGADCSGFVMKVYEAFGVSLPHSSYQQRSVGYAVSASDVRPGDIICYSGHVAIYIGDGKIVHASNRKEGIKISYNWQYRQVLAIRRIF